LANLSNLWVNDFNLIQNQAITRSDKLKKSNSLKSWNRAETLHLQSINYGCVGEISRWFIEVAKAGVRAFIKSRAL
jgi:hypothetical protein